MKALVTRARRLLAPTRVYYRLNVLRRFLAQDRVASRGERLSLARARLLLRGMTGDKRYLYADAPIGSYWPDFDASRPGAFNGSYAEMLDRKDALHHLMDRLRFGPPVVGVIRRGAFLPQGDGGETTIAQFLAEVRCAIVRPLLGPEPSPPWLLVKHGTSFELDGRVLDGASVEAILREGFYLVAEVPEDFLAGGEPARLEFLSIAMLRDRQTRQPFCAFALKPLATGGGSAATPLRDLLATAARIDPATGVLGRAASVVRGPRPERLFLAVDPATGEAIEGQRVPDWEAALATAHRAMNHLPMINAATFLLLRGRQGYMVVDASNRLEVAAAQLHGPLLGDARLRAARAALLSRRGGTRSDRREPALGSVQQP